jgi:hypothetical protein
MNAFLSSNLSWFFRAIDDSWFNPDNLYNLIQQLSTFINPREHVVIKGHLAANWLDDFDRAYLQGGSPTLMSRAAVIHVLRYFPHICGSRWYPADDAALGLIANRSFASILNWGDVHFTGPALPHVNYTFESQWRLHQKSHFSSFNQSCNPRSSDFKPLKQMVGVHTQGGIQEWKELAVTAHSTSLPDGLIMEYIRPNMYMLCLNHSEAIRLRSLEYLKEITPPLRLDDQRLQYSVTELLNWGRKLPRVPWLPSSVVQ